METGSARRSAIIKSAGVAVIIARGFIGISPSAPNLTMNVTPDP